MVQNPIQLSEICAYVELFGPPTIPIDAFVHLMGMMDGKYLELISGNGKEH